MAAFALSLYLPAVARQHQAGQPKSPASQLETRFDQQLSPAHVGATIKELAAQPHHLGSARGKAVAEAILAKFKDYGWDARIATYQVLFPTPKTRVLEMTAPTRYKALLKEPALKEDASSGQEGQLPTYNAWGGDGDVTGQLVYVNFGLPEDYETLERLGIDVKGKIVIARYGRSWRGIKPKVAAEHGAIGCIIYSDPREDGYFEGDVYPKGAFKNEYGVQRGAVMDMVIYPGDPLTPGVGATENAKRLERSAAPTILKIPVLPISYHDAQPLLAALEGPVVPADWRGALPITYHTGPGKATVHLQVACNWDLVPVYDVIATIKGAQYPDEWVVRGNHHDAWVNGASDPISGIAALLEEAKAIGALVKSGYRPKRTLVYCAWDGEEPGLIGSTEWVEDHAEELQQKAVAYINTDGNGRGFLGAGGSHALTQLMDGIAKDVTDPQTKVSVYERRKALNLVRAAPAKRKELLDNKTLSLSALGSGSDYSPFFQHLGVPSLNLGFGGEDDGGEYHSIYDSYDHYSRFKDPEFHYGVALAQVAGRAVLRLADAEVLPFDFTDLYRTISGYVNELTAQATQMRESTEMENRLIAAHTYQLAADPTQPFVAPAPKAEVPYLDFSPLQNALVMLEKSSTKLRDTLSAAAVPPAVRQRLNEALYRAEQSLLTGNGLPRRSWFKHTIYAPGFYTGYGVKTLPGIREAMEQRNWKEAREQVRVVAEAVQRLSRKLEECASLIP
ncbi:N-acetylated-alpha-linked acidic dipeptidase [Chitinophaga japonensis]|uniref:N-acetylated-alpha-linked acidic dipeptidase n=2 Tax=Chitinophaga japonensis TaxID=104662 RepID=A0A562SZ84_CHIJA|nr:N-acetylated-alpha-linked acidic dipeptidase [Chitinophaga japonensis]